MSVINDLKVYAETSTTGLTGRVLDATEYLNNSDREGGARPNTPIQSKLTNTVLKSVTSFIYGLVQASLANSDYSGSETLNVETTEQQWATILTNIIAGLSVDMANSLDHDITFRVLNHDNTVIGTGEAYSLENNQYDIVFNQSIDLSGSTITALKFVGDLEGTADEAKALTGWSSESTFTVNSSNADYFNFFDGSTITTSKRYELQLSFGMTVNNVTTYHSVSFPTMKINQVIAPIRTTKNVVTARMIGSPFFQLDLMIEVTIGQLITAPTRCQVFFSKNGGTVKTLNTTNLPEISEITLHCYKVS